MMKLVRSFISSIHGLLDQHLGMGIHRAGGFVQDQDGGIRQDGAGDRQQLHLALGDVGGLLVEHHVIAVRQGADEVIHVGGLGGGDDFLVRGIRAGRSGCSP